MSEKYTPINQLRLGNDFARLPEHMFHRQSYQGLDGVKLAAFNDALAARLGISREGVDDAKIAELFGGGSLLPESAPLAMKYTGHQFGYYNPDLGDGRGVLLGEWQAPNGVLWDLHLKGAGKTPYSRFADGRAVLRSSIREYVVSAAMKALGVPTTEALALVASNQFTMRNGAEPCAVVLRVTPCHIRFGHFEYLYHSQHRAQVKVLADYAIERYFPQLTTAENPYAEMFRQVVASTAELVARWQVLGFVHGVMNTDNMSLVGETFDYGPYTFLDQYDPAFISNKNDHEGRYRFESQPDIALWNLSCLAQTLIELVPRDDLIDSLDRFAELYRAAFVRGWSKRLGIEELPVGEVVVLIDQLLAIAEQDKLDLTRFVYQLVYHQHDEIHKWWGFASPELLDWVTRFKKACETLDLASCAVTPKYLPRTYMLEEVIREAHVGNWQPLDDLMAVVTDPYGEHPSRERYASEPPEWAASICLTCSS